MNKNRKANTIQKRMSVQAYANNENKICLKNKTNKTIKQKTKRHAHTRAHTHVYTKNIVVSKRRHLEDNSLKIE